MALARIPERARTPSVARAAVSPSAVVVTGVAVAVGLLVGLPAVTAIGVGLVCWAARVGVAAGRAGRRRRRAAQAEPIDPYAVAEPWRSFVQEAVTAQARFGQTVERCQPGPLQDRLREVTARVGDGVQECWRAAHLGASIAAVLAGLDPPKISRQLREVQEEQRGAGPRASSSDARDRLDQTEAALAGRLQTARRMEAMVQRTTDGLRVLTAQLDEAVAEAVQLSLAAGDPNGAQPIAGSVESVVGEIESLRRAMEEAEGAPVTGRPTTS
jgi:hypothetical protein